MKNSLFHSLILQKHIQKQELQAYIDEMNDFLKVNENLPEDQFQNLFTAKYGDIIKVRKLGLIQGMVDDIKKKMSFFYYLAIVYMVLTIIAVIALIASTTSH